VRLAAHTFLLSDQRTWWTQERMIPGPRSLWLRAAKLNRPGADQWAARGRPHSCCRDRGHAGSKRPHQGRSVRCHWLSALPLRDQGCRGPRALHERGAHAAWAVFALVPEVINVVW